MAIHDLSLYRKVEVQDPVKSGSFVDVTRQLGSSEVVFEEEDAVLDKLSFRILHGAALFIETLKVGDKVKFTGGYSVRRRDMLTKKVFFDGVVSALRPLFPDNGKLELEVVAEDILFLLTRNKPGRVTYPGVKRENQLYKRDFHFVDSIKMSEIVRGIVSEYEIPIAQVKIDPEYDFTFDHKDPVSQNEYESDYEFILRLLTGRGVSETKARDKDKRSNKLVNGHARLFMEMNQITGRSEFNVVPEEDLIGDESKVSFIYHSEAAKRVAPDKFDPTNNNAVLIMSGVSVTDNPDNAQSKEVQRHQDVETKAKGSKGSNAEASVAAAKKPRGAQVLEEMPDPEALKDYEIDQAKVKRDLDAGILDTTDVAGAVFRGKLKWADVKHYFVLREVVFEPTSRKLDADPESVELQDVKGIETSEAEKVKGKSGGGRGAKGTSKSSKKVNKPRVKAYGQTITFRTHGNIFVLCRRTYALDLPVGRYSGDWFATKVKHEFGELYKLELELAR